MSKNNETQYLKQLEFDEKLNNSWMSFFIDRKRFTWLIILLIWAVWYIWYKSLDLESSPEVQIWAATITTTFNWASPETVEDLVTKKIEQKIAKVKWIDTITSTSMEWNSVISVEFESDVDIQETLSNLKDKVDEAQIKLPADADESSVKEVSMDDNPIWTFSISWENYDDFGLYEYAKNIQDELEKNSLVSEVNISGWKEKEFWVYIDPKKLEKYNLTLDSVNSAISSNNTTAPIWSIKISGYKHSISVDSRFYSIQTLKNIVLLKKWDSWIIYLHDIAEVKEVAKEITSISRLSISGWEPLNAVTLSVKKKRWWSIIDLVSQWKTALEDMKNSWNIPSDLNIKTTLDESISIQDDFHHLVKDGMLTILLVFMTLFAIIWLKEALVAGTSVPLVLMATFWTMSWYGMTLNFLSMFALILSLWLLVDDAIVVISAMNQYKKTWKFTTREAWILVIRDYKRVLTTTTLTVVFIFASMMFMDGMMWKFIFSIPFVIVTTLLSSLFIAVTLNPALAVMIAWKDAKVDLEELKNKKWLKWYLRKVIDHWFISLHFLEKIYWGIISWLVSKTMRIRIFLIFILFLFMSSLYFPISWMLKVDFFPKWDEDNFSIDIEAEAWTELDKTSEIVKQVENVLMANKEIDSFSTSIWNDGSYYGSITVNLDKNRKNTSMVITENVRKEVKNIKNAQVNIVETASWPSAWSDFELKISGEDFTTLDKIANDVKAVVEKIHWAVNIESSRKALPFEFNIVLDKEKLALYNISSSQVTSFIRNVIDGTEATTIYKWEDEIKVRTIYDNASVDTFDKIKDLKLKNNEWNYVALRDLVTLDFESTVYSIKRSDQKRVVSITASANGTTSGMQIMSEFNKKMANYKLPSWYEFITWWSNDTSSQAMSSLFTSMMYGIICVIWLLVLLYDSYRQALLVMLTIPLSLIWVFYWLTIFNTSLSFPWMIWMVALFWIVVRNWIILFDQINHNLKEKTPFKEAIIEAWISRLEPVFLTSVCTALWMVPLTISTPDRRALWLAIICWLTTSTIFTLLALPSLYYIVFRKKYWVR